MPKDFGNTRVIKKLLPSQPGAIKLSRRFGDALVCVRYRHDARGRLRYTTVEIVVDESPVKIRDTKIVRVKFGFMERELRITAARAGAVWDDQAQVWKMPFGLAKTLGLVKKIVEK